MTTSTTVAPSIYIIFQQSITFSEADTNKMNFYGKNYYGKETMTFI